MGCHTWFYKKVDRSMEEARTLWIKNQKETIDSFREMLSNPLDECRVTYEWNEPFLQNCLNVYERQLRMVENGMCNVAVMNKQPEHSIYIPNVGFFVTDNTMPHDIFRKYGYPLDRLFSYQETIDYINNPKNECQIFETTNSKLISFWNLYPNGMIDFG